MARINLKDFKGIKVDIKCDKTIQEYAKKTKRTLMQPGVSPRSNRKNRKKPYWKGWDIKLYEERQGKVYRAIVWNKTNYQLTHLLENGHIIISQGRTTAAYSAPRPHIKPTFERIEPKFLRAMRDVKIEFEFK